MRKDHDDWSSSDDEDLCSKSQKMEFEVEKILYHFQDSKGKFHYVVKWKGYSEDESTCETLKDLNNCNKILLKYLEKEIPTDLDISSLRSKLELGEDSSAHDILLKQLSNTNTIDEKLLCSLIKIMESQITLLFTLNKSKINSELKRFNSEINLLLRCILAMDKVDPKLLLKCKKLLIMVKVYAVRERQLKNLEMWFKEIKKVDNNVKIVKNDVDFMFRPDFTYINETIFDKNIKFDNDIKLLGCKCLNCSNTSNCCNKNFNTKFVYSKSKKLRTFTETAIYECNKNCCCDLSCINRVVQNGSHVSVGIFKSDTRGWGVLALENIKKGTFIFEYIGELISQDEAEVRDVEYVTQNLSYIFMLDFNSDDNKELFAIDSTKYGNVTRFLNHSCKPNMFVFPVFIDCVDVRYPRLGFFARGDICEGEELTFDYAGNRFNAKEPKSKPNNFVFNIRCGCEQSNCRKWLFHS